MASYADVRPALATQARQIDLVQQVYERTPDSVSVTPAVIVTPANPAVVYHRTSAGRSTGLALFRYDVVVLGYRWGDMSGQVDLDQMLSTETGSVTEVLERDPTLNGTASATVVTTAGDYGSIVVADTEFVGVRFTVEVHA